MSKVDISYHYFLELQDLVHSLKTKEDTLDRFKRRREMAQHSQMNSEGFINRITEGEDAVLEELQKAKEKKKIFDTFTDEWETSAIILEEYGLPILTWCIVEFDYMPYVVDIGNRKYLYIFHNPEDAVGAKLRWA